jgi:hypothetical protein
VKKNTKSQTFLGGLLTIICILLLTGATYATGNDIFLKSKPIVSIEDIITPNRPLLHLTNETFPISLILQDYNMINYYDPSNFIYEIIEKNVINANGTTINKIHKLVPCEYHHFPNFDEDYFNTRSLGNIVLI